MDSVLLVFEFSFPKIIAINSFHGTGLWNELMDINFNPVESVNSIMDNWYKNQFGKEWYVWLWSRSNLLHLNEK